MRPYKFRFAFILLVPIKKKQGLEGIIGVTTGISRHSKRKKQIK